MNYSEIHEMADYTARHCGEQMFRTPCCGMDFCIFCEDTCPNCGSKMDWSK